jgi:hypothetical protein
MDSRCGKNQVSRAALDLDHFNGIGRRKMKRLFKFLGLSVCLFFMRSNICALAQGNISTGTAPTSITEEERLTVDNARLSSAIDSIEFMKRETALENARRFAVLPNDKPKRLPGSYLDEAILTAKMNGEHAGYMLDVDSSRAGVKFEALPDAEKKRWISEAAYIAGDPAVIEDKTACQVAKSEESEVNRLGPECIQRTMVCTDAMLLAVSRQELQPGMTKEEAVAAMGGPAGSISIVGADTRLQWDLGKRSILVMFDSAGKLTSFLSTPVLSPPNNLQSKNAAYLLQVDLMTKKRGWAALHAAMDLTRPTTKLLPGEFLDAAITQARTNVANATHGDRQAAENIQIALEQLGVECDQRAIVVLDPVLTAISSQQLASGMTLEEANAAMQSMGDQLPGVAANDERFSWEIDSSTNIRIGTFQNGKMTSWTESARPFPY